MEQLLNTIIIIGTLPPCPRCDLLTKIVTKKAELMKVDAEIRHIAYTSDEARQYASAVGLESGTAKDVTKKAGIEIDWSEMIKIHKSDIEQSEDPDPSLKQFEKLFEKVTILDKRLRPYENMAKEIGIMMTPVLIINGEIKHQGSVPEVIKIEEWLSGLRNNFKNKINNL